MKIEPLGMNDEVEALLFGEELPVSDLRSSNKTQLFEVHAGTRLIGIVGVEVHETVGLLRALVVDNSSRKVGYGQALVAKAEAWATGKGIKAIYLLTLTASEFFSRLGYEVMPRTQAPASIAGTAQFTGLCPSSATLSSATFMCKTFDANNQMQPTTEASAD